MIEERGATPLLKLLEHVGGWPVASKSWNESSWNLNTQLALLNTMYNNREIIDVTVNIDSKDSSMFVLQVDQPTLGLPSRDYYFEKGDYEKAFEAYLGFMITTAMLVRMDMNLTEDYDFVFKEMEAVLLLETDIAAVSWHRALTCRIICLPNRPNNYVGRQQNSLILNFFFQQASASAEERVHETELYVSYKVKEMQQNFNITVSGYIRHKHRIVDG
uniref:Peptidase M13 N-terminal domain-containing protein n=1 Tax=Eptatretus burgeri TaxID=7764 RepID=A0A8C4QQ84_EPTBU